MKKLFRTPLLISLITIASCAKGSQTNQNQRYKITFLNYDDTVLYVNTVEYGGTAIYQGETPTRPTQSSEYAYVFTGWDYSLDNITQDTIFIAQYKQAPIICNVTFNNYDGTLLYQTQVRNGSTAYYYGPTPTKPCSYNGFVYAFTGWDRPLENIQDHTIFTAQYKLVANTCTVTFKNYDGTILQTTTVPYGGTAVYNGPTPTKPNDGDTYYIFAGWDKSLYNITENCELIAIYNKSVPLELEISTSSAQSNWYKTILAEYNTQREAEGKAKIKFTYAVHEEDNLIEEVSDWANGPDLFSYVGNQTSTLYLKRALATIPEEYQAAIKEENGNEEVTTYATYVNKMIGYPYAADNGYFLYYDKDVLNANDVKTWDGIMAKATQARQFGYDAGDAWMAMGALFTFGADYQVKFTKQGNISSVNATFNTAEGLKSAKFLKKFYEDKASSKKLTTAAERAPAAANALCATIAGSHCLAGFKRQLGNKLGMAKLPTITVDGETKTLGSFLGYKLFGVNNAKSDIDRKALAHEVARYLTSADIQEKRFQEFSVMPSIKTLQQKPAVLEDAHVLAIKDQVYANAAHPQTTVPNKCWEAPCIFTTAISNKVDAGATADMTEARLEEQLEILNDSIKASK